MPSTAQQPDRSIQMFNFSQISDSHKEPQPRQEFKYFASKAKLLYATQNSTDYIRSLEQMVKNSTPKAIKIYSPADEPIIPNQYKEERILNTTFQTQKWVNGMMTKSSQHVPVKTVKLDMFVKGEDPNTPRINDGITKTRVKQFENKINKQTTEVKPPMRGDVDDVRSNFSMGSFRSNQGTGALWSFKK